MLDGAKLANQLTTAMENPRPQNEETNSTAGKTTGPGEKPVLHFLQPLSAPS